MKFMLTLGDDAPYLLAVNLRGGEGRIMKITQDLDVLQMPPLGKTLILPHILINVRQLTINQIVNAISISRESVENILLGEPGMTDVFIQPLPRFLT